MANTGVTGKAWYVVNGVKYGLKPKTIDLLYGQGVTHFSTPFLSIVLVWESCVTTYIAIMKAPTGLARVLYGS